MTHSGHSFSRNEESPRREDEYSIDTAKSGRSASVRNPRDSARAINSLGEAETELEEYPPSRGEQGTASVKNPTIGVKGIIGRGKNPLPAVRNGPSSHRREPVPRDRHRGDCKEADPTSHSLVFKQGYAKIAFQPLNPVDSPWSDALVRARSSAFGERSVATARRPGLRRSKVRAMHPEPVPRSATTRSSPSPGSRSSPAWTRSSVSGRGINTSGETRKGAEKNSRHPTM